MTRKTEKLRLGLFLLPAGHHLSAWRLPGSRPDGWTDFSYLARLAQTAERGKLDALFLADADGLWQPDVEALGRDAGALFLEPFTLLSALSATTKNIGLIASASTTYNHPYHIARKLASLDYISGGRAGWNIVTSSMAHLAGNFGTARHPDHGERYKVAAEFVEVVRELWGSFEDGVLICDKENGQYLDLSKYHRPNHHGEYFTVTGPLNLPRPPQGEPVLVQAGSSGPGKALATSVADIVFTVQTTIELAKDFYAEVKAYAASAGRNPSHVKVMPGIFPVIGRTRDEAHALFEQLQSYVDPRNGLSVLAGYGIELDMNGRSFDDPFPELPPTQGQQWRREVIIKLARAQGFTIGQMCKMVAATRGHFLVRGTVRDVADAMQEWFEGEACDGFNLMLPTMPQTLDVVVDELIPELQRRGIFRLEYEGRTFRENIDGKQT